MTGKKNAFDLLRILLAFSVLITHGIIIGGYHLTDPLAYLSKNQTNFGEFAVMGFFTLSGYLITASFINAGNIVVFASHRLLRILPGFWFCLAITGFVFAPLIFMLHENAAHFSFTGPQSAIAFVYHNFFLNIKQWSVRGTLDASYFQQALNGSLWSLFPEFQCYCFTMVAGACGLFQKNKIAYLVISVAVLIFFSLNFNFSTKFGPTILILSPALKLYASYIAGTLLYAYRDDFSLDRNATIFLFAFTLALIKFGGYNLISPLLIAMVLINAFQLFEVRLKYDLSYGIYIYGFPIQQLLAKVFERKINIIVFILFSLICSAAMGLLSYLFIERPFINLKKRTDPFLRSFFLKTGT